jgi:hypothetical protein
MRPARRGSRLIASVLSAHSDVLGDLWLERSKTNDHELDGRMDQLEFCARALSAAEGTQNFQALRSRYRL